LSDAWSAALAAATDGMPQLPSEKDEPEVPHEVEEPTPQPVEEEPVAADVVNEDANIAAEASIPTTATESLTTPDELPDVITADMLRARMAQRKKDLASAKDFEVPAELLVGLGDGDNEEWELESENAPAKGKSKKSAPVKVDKKPKKKKRRVSQGDDDDFTGYF
jgi:hypothetical protein